MVAEGISSQFCYVFMGKVAYSHFARKKMREICRLVADFAVLLLYRLLFLSRGFLRHDSSLR
jgi:hypothetical protein